MEERRERTGDAPSRNHCYPLQTCSSLSVNLRAEDKWHTERQEENRSEQRKRRNGIEYEMLPPQKVKIVYTLARQPGNMTKGIK